MTAVAIVAHTARRTAAEHLAHTLQADYVAMDDGTLGCEANHLRAWDWHQHNTTTEWSIVLEDDAIPAPDFRDQLAAALAVAPSSIVSLYLGTGNPPHWQPHVRNAIAAAGDACWLTSHNLLHAVGVAIRTELLPMQLDQHMPIDTAISNWAKRYGHRVAYTLPSLVDHADTTPVITTRHDGRPRTAPRHAHRHGSRDHWTATTAKLAI